jgi:transposase
VRALASCLARVVLPDPGRPPAPRRPARSDADREAERLRAENERLRAELAKTKAALDVVGKAHALLGLISESADTDPRSTR